MLARTPQFFKLALDASLPLRWGTCKEKDFHVRFSWKCALKRILGSSYDGSVMAGAVLQR